MNAREKADYDRVNALPRKLSGRVDFIINPNQIPAKNLSFHARRNMVWPNRKPTGLFQAMPFLSRPMGDYSQGKSYADCIPAKELDLK